ncbi:hypothetical protein [Paracoccus yeei]|nr:hypothetical protein [Paracoccus yeei]
MPRAPMRKGWAAAAIAVLSALTIVAGLALTGGPGTARKQNRDRDREQDLMALASFVDCLATEANALPTSLDPTRQCDRRLRVSDPHSGTPYRYQVLDPRRYRLCADFELPPDRPDDSWGRDAQGCIIRDFHPAPARNATIPWRR